MSPQGYTAANGDTDMAVSFAEPMFGNDFPDVPTVTKSHQPGAVFGGGSVIVNYTATDLAGNVNSCLDDHYCHRYVTCNWRVATR